MSGLADEHCSDLANHLVLIFFFVFADIKLKCWCGQLL